MKLAAPLLSISLAVILTACGSGSALPEASGKGSVRAVNAIKTSPEVGFLIEERSIGGMEFRQGTVAAPWDDLEYDFNFEVRFAGDLTVTRFATEHLVVVKDMGYTMLLSGTIDSPTVTVWEVPIRDFEGGETVFEAQFAHSADSLGRIDYYFAAEGVAPVLGEEVGSLSFGEILAPIDFDAGDYTLIATTSGNPNDVVFESVVSTYPGAAQYTISLFDGGASTNAPFVGRAFTTGSIGMALSDVNYPATNEFVNGSLPLGTIDIYDDDMQTSIVVDNLPHKGISAELDLLDGVNTFYYTSSDTNSPVLIEQALDVQTGLRARTIAVGDIDAFNVVTYVPDRRPVETHAKLQMLSTSNNFDFVTVFALEVDEVLDDQFPLLPALESGTTGQTIAMAADSYDIYVRQFSESEILAGPIRLDLAIGDVVNAMLFDNVDPAILDFEIIPNN